MGTKYIICAAGAGSRISGKVYDIPKPLVRMGGVTMLEWSLRSLQLTSKDEVIIVVQAQHKVRKAVAAELSRAFPHSSFDWVEVKELTRGQLETALCAKHLFNDEDSLVIFNCDTFFESPELLGQLRSGEFDGFLPCSIEPGDNWSFCELGDDGLVKNVAEKKRISDKATVGYYYFKSAKEFLYYSEKYKKELGKEEWYVAPLYNLMIEDGKTVGLNIVDLFKPFGSVEQLDSYWGVSMEDLRSENSIGRIVVDLDNTLTIDASSPDYTKKEANRDVIEKLVEYKNRGYEIFIHTSRRMKTHGGDESRILAEIGDVTLKWLNDQGVPFDGIRFGKPFAENGFYIDDKAIRPDEFVNKNEDELLALTKQKN